MEHATEPFENNGIRPLARLKADTSGSTIVEAAIALPIMIMLLLGAVSYGIWFMAAHSLQQAANEGARASLAAMDQAERVEIVNDVVESGVLASGTVAYDKVTVQTSLVGNQFIVRLSYDPSAQLLLASGMVPLPKGPIVRTASVRLSSL